MPDVHESNKTMENWFHLYSDALFGWAYHKTSSKEVAEDLVQETFLSAVKGFKNFKQNSQPKTWLFAILNNKLIDHYRKKAKSATLANKGAELKFINQTNSFFDSHDNWLPSAKDVAWEEEVHLLDDEEFRGIMENCVGNLPDKWQLAIISKYLSDKSADQICQEMKVTQSNYWQIVHRAKLMLKKCIDHNWIQ